MKKCIVLSIIFYLFQLFNSDLYAVNDSSIASLNESVKTAQFNHIFVRRFLQSLKNEMRNAIQLFRNGKEGYQNRLVQYLTSPDRLTLYKYIPSDMRMEIVRLATDFDVAFTIPDLAQKERAVAETYRTLLSYLDDCMIRYGGYVAPINQHEKAYKANSQIKKSILKSTAQTKMPQPKKKVSFVDQSNESAESTIGQAFNWIIDNKVSVVTSLLAAYGVLAHLNHWWPFNDESSHSNVNAQSN